MMTIENCPGVNFTLPGWEIVEALNDTVPAGLVQSAPHDIGGGNTAAYLYKKTIKSLSIPFKIQYLNILHTELMLVGKSARTYVKKSTSPVQTENPRNDFLKIF
jgi:hypothetical protein